MSRAEPRQDVNEPSSSASRAMMDEHLRDAEALEQQLSDYEAARQITRGLRNEAVYGAWLHGAAAREIAQRMGLREETIHGLLAQERQRRTHEGEDVFGIEWAHGRRRPRRRRRW